MSEEIDVVIERISKEARITGIEHLHKTTLDVIGEEFEKDIIDVEETKKFMVILEEARKRALKEVVE